MAVFFVCVCFLFIDFSEKAPARTPLLSLLACHTVAFLVPYCSWPSLMIYPPESNPKPACLRTTAYSTGGSKAKQMHMLYRKTLTASKIGKRSGRWSLMQTHVRSFESLPRKKSHYIPILDPSNNTKINRTSKVFGSHHHP